MRVGDRLAENAVWGYPKPRNSSPLPADHVAFYHGAMDAFFEEDEEVFAGDQSGPLVGSPTPGPRAAAEQPPRRGEV